MSDYTHSEAMITSHATDWCVHVLGPDEVHTFPTSGEACAFATDLIDACSYLFPRDSEFAPMVRCVISPPTGITVTEEVA